MNWLLHNSSQPSTAALQPRRHNLTRVIPLSLTKSQVVAAVAHRTSIHVRSGVFGKFISDSLAQINSKSLLKVLFRNVIRVSRRVPAPRCVFEPGPGVPAV
jgi:hypothetical protein